VKRLVFGVLSSAALLATFAVGEAMTEPPSEEQIVKAHRETYGARISPAEAPILLRAIAGELTARLGRPFGVLVKTSGNHCGGIACDIICDASEHWDVLSDGPDAAREYSGTAQPSWQPKGIYAPRVCEFVPPSSTVPEPAPDPGIPSSPECPVCPPDQQQLVMDLQAQILSLTAEREVLRRQRDELLSRPAPTCEVRPGWVRRLGIGCEVR